MKKKEHNGWIALGVSLIFLLVYFTKDYLWEKLWILAGFPAALALLGMIVSLGLGISHGLKSATLMNVAAIAIVSGVELASSELFKSSIVLEATLMDDRSAIHLKLRENNRFEVISSNPFTDIKFEGNYLLAGNKIIFRAKPYENDFIPDTLFIIDNKIIRAFDDAGQPVTEYASYFEIKKNELKNAP
jgi:hypothetical protein